MKKSIIMTLVLALIISLATVVKAFEVVPATATVSLSKDVAEKGEEVTATISIADSEGKGLSVTMADFTINYDSSVLEFVSAEGTEDVIKGTNSLSIGYMGHSGSTFTLKFKVVGEKGAKDTISFVNKQMTATGVEYKIDSASAELTVGPVEDGEDPTPVEPTNPEVKDPADEDEKPADEKPAESGKPDELPPAGVNYFVIGGVVIALIAVAAIAKKIND